MRLFLLTFLALLLPATTRAGSPWAWPITNPHVLRGFDPPPQRWLPGHRGIDLAAHPAQAVYAAGAGTVTFAAPVGGVSAIAITHTNNLKTTYLPVTPSVHNGDQVSKGDLIGTIAPSPLPHCPTTCLHWGLRRGPLYLNPLLLLGLAEVRLLPHWPNPSP
ncbi:M23 family metallopeptidase [Acrocarpospora catenulata]|uniref:M23 family metallopeptidase n=1 Tax=Acrocarpospora catenulata TaxID=2836182 RepID=UPI0020239B6C|nr:M23 family metallopeptidase [Acrocarpospora catenulata]